MVIKNKRKDMVNFSQLKKGEVFILDNDVYMKIVPIEDSYSEVYNAVNLADGDLISCSDKQSICLVNCELVVE